jgi:ribosomal protein S14
MEKKKFNILKEKIKNKNFMINELKILILKSILKNKKIRLSLKHYIYIYIKKTPHHSKISYQKSVCFKTGKYKSIMPNFSLSRHTTKSNLNNLKLDNIKKIT